MKARGRPSPPADRLRKRAEKLLATTRREIAQMPVKDVQKLVHELQVHQIELEMQNDELRQTQSELEQTRDRFEDLYDFAPVGHLTLNPQGEIFEANLTAAKLLGRERDQLLHEKFTRFVVPESQDAFYLLCRRIFGSETRQEAELVLVNDQSRRLVVEATAVRNGSGQRRLCRFNLTDITGRKQAELALHELNQFNQQIIAGAKEGIVVNGLDLKHLVWNPFMEQLTGLPAAEVLGKHPEEVFPFLRPAGIIDRMQRALAGETLPPVEVYFHVPQSGRSGWASNSSSPLRNAQGEIIGVIGIITDITARKHAEERIASRVQAVLAGIDHAIAHIPDRQKFMDEVCRVAVDQGGFKLAWIGLTAPDGSVRPVAQAGVVRYLKGLRVVTQDEPAGRGAVGRAIRENRSVVIEDVSSDASMAPWHERLQQYGLRYVAAFPLRIAGRVVGAFQVYAPRANFFDDHELGLLTRVSDEISFALTAMAEQVARQAAEEARRESEARLQTFMDNSPAMFFIKDPRGRYLHFNHTLAEVFHLSLEKSVGKTDAELFPQPQAAVCRANDRKMLKAGVPMTFEEVTLQDDGPHTHIVTKFPLRDDRGEIYAFGGIATDITERKQMEETVRRSEYQLTNFFNQAPIGIVWLSASGHILRTNQAHLDLLGYAATEFVGHFFNDFCEEPSPRLELLERMVSGETVHNLPMKLRCRNGTIRHVLVDANSFWSGDQFQYSSVFVRDVTDRIRLEQEILQTGEREHRRIAQDLHDGLGQLLVGTAYLTSTLREKLAAQSLPETADLGRILEVIYEAITQTRNMARGIQPVEAEPNGLMVALQRLADRTRKLFRIGCQFNCRQPVMIPNNEIATHLFRIAQEAITNAIKHGKPGKVEISLTETPERINLAVKDNGRGLPIRPRKPTGMGLRIMRYRAGMIGGSLAIQKEPGGGTTVVCTVYRPAESVEKPLPKTTRKRN